MRFLIFALLMLVAANGFAQETGKRRAALPLLVELYFPEGSTTLTEDHRSDLQVIAKHLIAHPELGIVIIGHTDDIGERSTNQKVAVKRAKAVRDYLIYKGVGKERIIFGGQGEDFPLLRDTTDYGRSMNRRVTLRYYYLEE
ncbi:OmpA family protein [bacterium]|nr:OmpA family protein [bacterium]